MDEALRADEQLKCGPEAGHVKACDIVPMLAHTSLIFIEFILTIEGLS